LFIEKKFLKTTPDKVALVYVGWHVETTDSYRLAVYFNKAGGLVTSIECTSRKEAKGCNKVNGVEVGTTEEELLTELGEPSKVMLEGSIKTVEYEHLNLKYRLEKQKVYSIVVSKQ
jgi:hypothetical protein